MVFGSGALVGRRATSGAQLAAPPRPSKAVTRGAETCCVYWGLAGCGLPPGHEPDMEVRVHRQCEPSRHAVAVRDAFLSGGDPTTEELRMRAS